MLVQFDNNIIDRKFKTLPPVLLDELGVLGVFLCKSIKELGFPHQSIHETHKYNNKISDTSDLIPHNIRIDSVNSEEDRPDLKKTYQ